MFFPGGEKTTRSSSVSPYSKVKRLLAWWHCNGEDTLMQTCATVQRAAAVLFGTKGLGNTRWRQWWIEHQPWCGGSIGGVGARVTIYGCPVADALAQFVVVAFSITMWEAAGALPQLLKRLRPRLVEKNLPTFVAHRVRRFLEAAQLQARQHGPQRGCSGGWYDIFLPGTINAFTTVHYHGGEGQRQMPAGDRPDGLQLCTGELPAQMAGMQRCLQLVRLRLQGETTRRKKKAVLITWATRPTRGGGQYLATCRRLAAAQPCCSVLAIGRQAPKKNARG